MDDDKLEQALRTVDPAKRGFLKQLVVSTAFAVPIIASYSVRNLAQAVGPSGVSMTISTLTMTISTVMTTVTTTT